MPHSVIRIIFTTQSQSEHQLTVSLDNIQLKKLEIPANEKQTHTVEYGIEYSKAQYKSLLFDCQGTECEQKTLHVESITLDNKPISMDKFMSKPTQTDYIASLDPKELQHTLLNAGTKFGWYGKYQLNVLFGDRKDYEMQPDDPKVLMGMLHL